MNDKPGTARDLIGTYLAEQCTVIIDSEAQLRAGEDVVHTTRVAVRRLRSTIRVFADLFDSDEAADLESELVWWAILLGEVRDLDILAARQTALLAELPPELLLGPVAATIQAEVAAQRKQAADAITDALNSERYRKLIGLIHHWRSDPPFTAAADFPSPEVINPAIKKAKKKAGKRLGAAVDVRQAGEPSDELFHSARKASKRYRYAVEAAAPVWGTKADKIVAQRKDLQDLLGNYQDGIVSAAFLRELGARLGIRSGQNGFSYGILYAREVAAGDSLLEDLKPFL